MYTTLEDQRKIPVPVSNGEEYLTIQEAADYLKISVSSMRRLLIGATKEIPTAKIGRLVRIPKSEIEKYLTRKTK